MSKGFRSGFQLEAKEFAAVELRSIGNIPSWLNGTLIRNGPARFKLNGTSVNHWFDGLAMLQRLSFRAGRITFASKFIQSRAYRDAERYQRLASREFGSNPEEGLFKRILSTLTLNVTDNTNVNTTRINDHFLALTETPNIIEFDPHTLETIGPFTGSQREGQISTAHPHFDHRNGIAYNLWLKLGPKNRYVIQRIDPSSQRSDRLTSIAVDRPGYIHSFSISQRYIIISDFPFRLDVPRLLFSGRPYIENYEWLKDLPTRFWVVDRDNGRLTAMVESEACFAFHHVNAFEENGEVVVDALCYPDPEIVRHFYFKHLLDSGRDLTAAEFSRFRLDLNKRSIKAEQPFSGELLEFPRIHYRAHNGGAYNVVYAVGQEGDSLDSLTRLNIKANDTRKWREDHCYPGEPLFVPQPGSDSEDSGVVLSVVLDTSKEASFVLVLDAASMTEIARAPLEEPLPFGLHGQFWEDV